MALIKLIVAMCRNRNSTKYQIGLFPDLSIRTMSISTLRLAVIAASLTSVIGVTYDCNDASALESALEAVQGDEDSAKSTINLRAGTYQLTRQMSIFANHALDIIGEEGVIIRAPELGTELGCVDWPANVEGGEDGGHRRQRRHLAADAGETNTRPGLRSGDEDNDEAAMHQGADGYMLAVCQADAAVNIKDIMLDQGDVSWPLSMAAAEPFAMPVPRPGHEHEADAGCRASFTAERR